MTNVRPLKLNMTFKQAIEMVAKGGKPPSAISKEKQKTTASKSKKAKRKKKP